MSTPKTFCKFILLALLAVYFSPSLHAQDTEYWFVAPDASYLHSGCDRPTFIMISTGSEPARVTIDMPQYSGFPTETRDIPANSSWQYYFGTTGQPSVDVIENSITTAGAVTKKGLHIKSDTGPIFVYYQVDGSCSKDIFALKGDKALGQEFYTPFQTSYSRNSYSDAFAQIHIVATKDGTVIDIVPTLNIVAPTGTGSSGTGNTGTTSTITLNRGETFLIKERVQNLTSRLSGTHVKARDAGKPISVTVADDPLVQPGGGSHDLNGDQLVPVNNLGTNYVIIRGLSSGTTSDNAYILAIEDGTQIFRDGNATPIATIDKGKTHHINMGGASGEAPIPALYLQTSKPAYCWQQSAIGNEMGSALIPSMYSIGSKKIIFSKGATSGLVHHLFLIFRKGHKDGFRINGNTQTITANAIPGLTDWEYAKVEITSLAPGQCVVENLTSVFAMGYFYGNISGTALYGYLSGFGQLEFPEITYKCVDESVVLDAGYAKSYKWWKGTEADEPADGSPLVLSTSNTYTVPVNQTGKYSVKVNQDPFNIVATTDIVNDAYRVEATVPKYAKKASSQNLTASVTRPAGKSFSWEIEGGTTSVAAGTSVPNVVWNSVGSYNVKLTVKNSDLHCTDTLIQKQVKVYDIQDDYVGVPKNSTILIDVLANDDFSAITATPTIGIVTNGTYGTATIESGKVKYVKTPEYTTNIDEVRYSVSYNGEVIDEATIYIKTNSLLTVVKESGDDAKEANTPGRFFIKYVDTDFKFDKALKINYKLEGTAICDQDYVKPTDYDCITKTGFVTMPINGQSVQLNITPKDNYKVEGDDRTVRVAIISVEVIP